MKRKKTGVRSPRKTSARPTRQKPSPVKLREGGRQSSPFKTEWKYLDEIPGGGSPASTPKGRDRADRSQRSLPSRSVTYYVPPRPAKPFRDFTDEQVLKWLAKQPERYRRQLAVNAEIWVNVRGKSSKEIIAYEPGTGRAPQPIEIVAYLRAMATPPCSCGHNGNPYDRHQIDAKTCFKHKPAALEDDDDDDLPF